MLSEIFMLIIKVICGAVAIFCTTAAIYAAGPALETKYWPVVSKLKILTIEKTDDNFVKIRVQFTKLRDCEYLGLAWFVGDRPNDFERVAVTIMRDPADVGSPNRPVGTQRSGPWIIAISPEEFKDRSFAQLLHRCHAFWTTKTEFYP